jgi:DNA-binding NarL/FixJ family response regulator
MLLKSVKIGIADENTLFGKLLRFYLSEQTNITVTIQVTSIYDLIYKLRESHIDILLMDICWSGLNGIDTLKVVRSEYPHLKIVVVSMSRDMDQISDLLDAGIHGYVSKTDEQQELLNAITDASENKIYRNKIFTEALYWSKQSDISTRANGIKIAMSEREKKILQLIWQEKSNKEIADELFLGVRSVEKIRQDLKDKVGAKSTIGLLKYAIDKRIIGNVFVSRLELARQEME